MDKHTVIRWGILGLGKIAHKFAADLKESEGAELVAVGSRSLEKSKTFARRFGVESAFGSYEALVDSAEVDVVYIATPHPFHVKWALMCVQKGKAVLCEKPMGMHPAEVQQLITAACAQQVFLMEGLWTRFIPATEKLLSLLQEECIGEIRHIEVDFGFRANPDPDGRLFNRKLGGGALLDIGIYPIYLSLLLLGEPDKITAQAKFTDQHVDAECAIEFNYATGARASLFATLLKDTPTEAIIHGTQGTLKLHTRFHHSERISLYRHGTLVESFDLPYRGNGYVHEILEVGKCLKERKKECMDHSLDFSLKLNALVDRVRGAF